MKAKKEQPNETDAKGSGGEPEKPSGTASEPRFVVFEDFPFSPRLEGALSEIRNIMKREKLMLCLLQSDDRIYFIHGGKS